MSPTENAPEPAAAGAERFQTLRCERQPGEPRIARITLNRPERLNAINQHVPGEIRRAVALAEADDEVHVIVLAGAGRAFCAGYDLQDFGSGRAEHPCQQEKQPWEPTEDYAEMKRYTEDFMSLWRSRKPTIAMVHGACIAGGLMLAWACDLIVASQDAVFCDPVVTMGVCGVEWFVHPWELGPRKAKEMLFTADVWSADEAHRLGMVNHVVPREELSSFVLKLAGKIAAKPSFALKLTKEAVNRSVDVMGQPAAIEQAFALHQLCHAHNLQEFGMVVDPSGLHPSVRKPTSAKI